MRRESGKKLWHFRRCSSYATHHSGINEDHAQMTLASHLTWKSGDFRCKMSPAGIFQTFRGCIGVRQTRLELQNKNNAGTTNTGKVDKQSLLHELFFLCVLRCTTHCGLFCCFLFSNLNQYFQYYMIYQAMEETKTTSLARIMQLEVRESACDTIEERQ